MSLPVKNNVLVGGRADISDGCRWRCPDCRTAVSIRKGSFFEKSKLTLQKWLLLMHWWSRQYPVKDAKGELDVSERVAISPLSKSQYYGPMFTFGRNHQTWHK